MFILKDFLKTIDGKTYVVIFIGSCSIGMYVNEVLKNDKLCSYKVKRVIKTPNTYAITLK